MYEVHGRRSVGILAMGGIPGSLAGWLRIGSMACALRTEDLHHDDPDTKEEAA